MTQKAKVVSSSIPCAILLLGCAYCFFRDQPDIVGTVTAIREDARMKYVQVSYHYWHSGARHRTEMIFWVDQKTPISVRKWWKRYPGSPDSLLLGQTIEVWDVPKFVMTSNPPQCSGFREIVIRE
jgi:hypothetical protein